LRNLFVRRHPFGEEELSAYLDGRLSPAESARLERHLTSCGPCRRHLKELRAVVEGLRTLPSTPVPRSFTLRPEQVGVPRRRRPVGAAWLPRAFAFGPAGAAVATLVLFVVLVGVDLGTLGGGGVPEGAAPARSIKEMAPQADQAYRAAPGTTDGFVEPSTQVAPAAAPTPAPGMAPSTGAEDREAAGTPQAAGTPEAFAGASAPTETPAPTPAASPPVVAGVPAPMETPAPEAEAPPPTATAEGGGDTGRWVLRGFQGLAGAAFLASVAMLWWRRRAGRI
jgi:hypothetical protein